MHFLTALRRLPLFLLLLFALLWVACQSESAAPRPTSTLPPAAGGTLSTATAAPVSRLPLR